MRLRLADLALLLCLISNVAGARESDRQQEMTVEADDTDTVLADDGQTVLVGNVLITQGTLRIEADRAIVTRTAGDIARVVFEGRQARLQQENDNGALMVARAARIEYDVAAETVLLVGGVSITHGGDDLRGERVTYDLKNGRLTGAGDGTSGGRVRMTIQPRPAKPEAPATPAQEPGER